MGATGCNLPIPQLGAPPDRMYVFFLTDTVILLYFYIYSMDKRRIAVALIAVALGTAICRPAEAQIGGAGAGLGGPGLSDQAALAEGQPLGELNVEIQGGQDDVALREAARKAFGFAVGSTFNAVVAETALGRVRALPGVRDAAYRLTFQPATGTLRLVLLLTLGTPGPEAPKGIWLDRASRASQPCGVTTGHCCASR